MKLYLKNHNYRYAVEQMMLNLFPEERPEYPETPPEVGENAAVSTLSHGALWVTAVTALTLGNRHKRGTCRVQTDGLLDKLSTDRAFQKILKLSFYRAAVALLGREPPWGALTGVRPVKIPTRAMEQGKTPRAAEEVLRSVYRVSADRRTLAMDCAKESLKAKRSLKPDEISLYVGIPFCPTRCAYCSFVSADVKRSLQLVAPFLEALHREIIAAGALLNRLGLSIRSVYIGGGTPTTLSAEQLDALMGQLSDTLDFSRCTEYTVEAGRPDTITAAKLAAIRRGGADRVSVNPQSMSDAVLAAMGRAHTAEDSLRAFALVRQSGIPCINMDLIAGLPRDTPAGFRDSLDRVLALAPENITVHTLALKKGSRLMGDGTGPAPVLPAPEDVAEMLDYAWRTLRSAGQMPYYLYRQKYMSGSFENVGWCTAGTESLYNICMMEELHTILSLGGGGVTKLVNPGTGYIERISNPKYPYEYNHGVEKVMCAKERMVEFYANIEKERV